MAVKTQFLQALAVQEAAYNEFTHAAIIRAGVEVTEAGVNVQQTIKLGTMRVNSVIRRAVLSPVKAFENPADAANNSTTITVKTVNGAGADITALFTAVQLNKNGAAVTADQVQNTPTTPSASGDSIVAVLSSMALKNLAALTKGEVHLFFEIHTTGNLNAATAAPFMAAGFATIEQLALARGITVEEAEAQLAKDEKEEAERMAGKGKGAPREKVDYEGKTVAELKDLARERGVSVPSDARKDEIIEALEEAETEPEPATA